MYICKFMLAHELNIKEYYICKVNFQTKYIFIKIFKPYHLQIHEMKIYLWEVFNSMEWNFLPFGYIEFSKSSLSKRVKSGNYNPVEFTCD